jgi:hypothetical protein
LSTAAAVPVDNPQPFRDNGQPFLIYYLLFEFFTVNNNFPVSAVIEHSPRFSDTDFADAVPFQTDEPFVNTPLMDELSNPLVGQWNTLVSTTNWEKGEIINRWRQAIIEAGLPKAAYSDDVWAKRVGNVSPQHAGRLRRVAERFGSKSADYPKLYWSHFQVALDWDDAELWLEGAAQNDWSVAQMKVQRWETLGGADEFKPRDEDIITAEIDEDVNPRNDSFVPNSVNRMSDRTELRTAPISGAVIVDDTPPFRTDDGLLEKREKKPKPKREAPTTKAVMESLNSSAELPADLADALETLKTAVLNHKLSGWKEVSAPKVAGYLESLKQLLTSE